MVLRSQYSISRCCGICLQRRGATIAMHLLDPAGCLHDVYGVEAAASHEGISIRTGCFCNPGAGEEAHDITPEDMQRCFDDLKTAMSLRECQQAIEDATGKVPNTFRVSLGVASNFADVQRFLVFAGTFRNLWAAGPDG